MLFYYRDTPETGHCQKLFQPESMSTPQKMVVDETKSTISATSEISDIAK